MGLGRRYPTTGSCLARIGSGFRCELAREFYVDIDMENAVPFLLAQHELVTSDKETFAPIISYAYYRDEFWSVVTKRWSCTNKTAKKLFITLIFGGSVHRWLTDNQSDIPSAKAELEVHGMATASIPDQISIFVNACRSLLKKFQVHHPRKPSPFHWIRKGIWYKKRRRILSPA